MQAGVVLPAGPIEPVEGGVELAAMGVRLPRLAGEEFRVPRGDLGQQPVGFLAPPLAPTHVDEA